MGVMTELPLNGIGAGVTLDVNGDGTITFGPTSPGEYWKVTSTTIETSTGTLIPTATIYLDYVNPNRRVDGTAEGNNDTTDTPYVVQPGHKVVVQFTDGDPGAVATASLQGSRFVRGQVIY